MHAHTQPQSEETPLAEGGVGEGWQGVGGTSDSGAFRVKVCICDDLQSGGMNEPSAELDNLLFPYYFPSFNSLCASIIVHFLVASVCVCVGREWGGDRTGNLTLPHRICYFTAIWDNDLFYHPQSGFGRLGVGEEGVGVGPRSKANDKIAISPRNCVFK